MITDEGRRWPAGMYGLPTRAGLLKDIASFDATFFSVSAKQADKMDPQLRLLLEVCYETILDSGRRQNAGEKERERERDRQTDRQTEILSERGVLINVVYTPVVPHPSSQTQT